MEIDSKSSLMNRYSKQIQANMYLDELKGEDDILEAAVWNSNLQTDDILEQLYEKYPHLKNRFDIGDYVYFLLDSFEGGKKFLKEPADFEEFADIVAYSTIELCDLLNDFLNEREEVK